MTLSTPAGCREEALRQGRLADEAKRRGDKRGAVKHLDRARELTLLALKLEQDEAKEGTP